MKLTWFAGTTIRIHIGGSILVSDPQLAPVGVDAGELVSGADRAFALASEEAGISPVDLGGWRPRTVPRAIDEGITSPVLLHRIGGAGVLVDAAGEPPLLLLAIRAPPPLGWWASGSVAVLFGSAEELIGAGLALLGDSSPRLIALAAAEEAADTAIAALRERLDGAAMVALEPGLAVEI